MSESVSEVPTVQKEAEPAEKAPDADPTATATAEKETTEEVAKDPEPGKTEEAKAGSDEKEADKGEETKD
jgi:hypothetical protein